MSYNVTENWVSEDGMKFHDCAITAKHPFDTRKTSFLLQCYEEAEFIPVFALRRICRGVRSYEERGKDTIASVTSFIKLSISTEADEQPQPSTSKHAVRVRAKDPLFDTPDVEYSSLLLRKCPVITINEFVTGAF
ncbi:hypothetical protein M513_13321, partial [Trichuris suis]